MTHDWHSRTPSASALEADVPTYQYACTECGHRLEAVQSFHDEPLTECPVCGGRLRKQYSSVGVVFKGSGFYRTDSRAAAGKAAGSGESDGASKTDATKPDATKPDKAKPDKAAKPAAAKSEGAKKDTGSSSTSTTSSTSAPK